MKETNVDQLESHVPENDKKLIAIVVSIACFAILSFGYTLFRNINSQNKEDYSKSNQTHAIDDFSTTTTQNNTDFATSNGGLQEEAKQKPTDYHDSEKKVSSAKGLYAFASERLLTESDLNGLTKNDMKIMRNEIYARHGYIFKTKSMKKYFAAQPWYEGLYDEVSSMLSEIEIKNVEFIKKHE